MNININPFKTAIAEQRSAESVRNMFIKNNSQIAEYLADNIDDHYNYQDFTVIDADISCFGGETYYDHPPFVVQYKCIAIGELLEREKIVMIYTGQFTFNFEDHICLENIIVNEILIDNVITFKEVQ